HLPSARRQQDKRGDHRCPHCAAQLRWAMPSSSRADASKALSQLLMTCAADCCAAPSFSPVERPLYNLTFR
ncbi:MAG TPA: hypothetical protein VII90_00070, partial [Anaerolineales bacterium]